MTLTRRQALGRAGAFAFVVGGAPVWLTPREARAQAAQFVSLDAAQIRALEAFGEVLLPGAREAGIAHFIDHHLGVPAPDCLLMLRYLDVPPPYIDFYRAGLAALDAASRAAHDAAFAELGAGDANALVSRLARESPQGWMGPPAPLFFFVVRNDAVDVVYGTPEGFEKLGIPYMQHILPPARW